METFDQIEANDDFFNLEVFEPDTLPAVKASTRPESTNRWDPRLILDLAFAIDPLEEILPRYGLSHAEFEILSKTGPFRRELAVVSREVRENGLTFQRKAQFQAESYLEILDDLVYDDAVAANTRLEAIRSTVAWANLVPKEKKDDTVNATQVNVNISF